MANVLILNCSPVRDGATAQIAKIAQESLQNRHITKNVCIDDYAINFCKGCRSCHQTAACIQRDDTDKLIAEFDRADVLLLISPSYWADVPGQFKVFIDRCTPWCNTHEPHASLSPGKKGYAIVLRTGPSMRECNRIIETIEHFFGHMEIELCESLGLCSVENRSDAANRADEVIAFCQTI